MVGSLATASRNAALRWGQFGDETIGQGTQDVVLAGLGLGAAAPPIVITAR